MAERVWVVAYLAKEVEGIMGYKTAVTAPNLKDAYAIAEHFAKAFAGGVDEVFITGIGLGDEENEELIGSVVFDPLADELEWMP